MFPSLPGDPPLPETLGAVAIFLFVICIPLFFVSVRVALSAASLLGAVILLVVGTIGARNIGQWGELKRELVSFSVTVRRYESVHGKIDSNEDAKTFYKQNWRTFTFGKDGPEVDLVYLWWHRPGRVGIVWGNGGTAAFDLRTMLCVYSD